MTVGLPRFALSLMRKLRLCREVILAIDVSLIREWCVAVPISIGTDLRSSS